MQAQSNEQIVRQFVEQVYNNRNVGAIDQLLDPNNIIHTPHGDLNFDQSKQILTELLSASPDVHITIDNLNTQGDQVSLQWTGTGTHQGEFMGKSPTGKRVTITGNATLRIANGKIVESTNQYDYQNLMTQLSR
jgi:predicted ester cyclase